MEAAYRGGAQGFGDGSTMGFIAGGISSTIDVIRSNRIMSKMTGMCFVAGTQVQTEEGKVNIEEIEAGDRVWAENPETGEKGVKRVVRTFDSETEELVRVYAGGEEIITTTEHPFYVAKRGWTKAIELRAGDILVSLNGEYVILEKIEHELLESPVKVYNFEVEDFHTYYVGDSGVLVHNTCNPTSASQMQKQVERGQAPKYVDRVDSPHIEGQKPHIHFADKTSINIDGTIHDKHRGIPTISNKEAKWLQENGWSILKLNDS